MINIDMTKYPFLELWEEFKGSVVASFHDIFTEEQKDAMDENTMEFTHIKWVGVYNRMTKDDTQYAIFKRIEELLIEMTSNIFPIFSENIQSYNTLTPDIRRNYIREKQIVSVGLDAPSIPGLLGNITIEFPMLYNKEPPSISFSISIVNQNFYQTPYKAYKKYTLTNNIEEILFNFHNVCVSNLSDYKDIVKDEYKNGIWRFKADDDAASNLNQLISGFNTRMLGKREMISKFQLFIDNNFIGL